MKVFLKTYLKKKTNKNSKKHLAKSNLTKGNMVEK